jgi:hypothetical protein
MTELFLTIKDFPDYEINKVGIIRNKQKKKNLQPFLVNDYFKINLWNNNKSKSVYLHRILAITFIPNPLNLPEVNHIDGNKHNNQINNLEWCTRKENIQHSYNNNLQIPLRSNTNPKSKSVLQFTLKNNFIKKWNSVMDIERELGIKSGAISNCCLGKSKTSGNFIWKYV